MKVVLKSISWTLFYFFIQILISATMIFYSISKGMEKSFVDQWINNNLLIITLISNFLFILIISLFYKKKNTNFLYREREDRRGNILSYIILFTSVFLFSMAISLVMYFDSLNQITSSVNYYNNKFSNLGLIFMVLNLLIFSPIAEEILCRGYMITKLKKEFSPKVAVVISSVIFGFMHIFAGGFLLAFMATIMGFLFGFIYIKTKSLNLAIIAHSIANFPDFISFILPEINYDFRLLIGIILFVSSISAFVIWIKLENEQDKNQIVK